MRHRTPILLALMAFATGTTACESGTPSLLAPTPAVVQAAASSTGGQAVASNAGGQSGTSKTCILANGTEAPRGFDAFGYNRCAGNFVGAADGTDKVLDGKVWGDPTYANDHLVMKWNGAWDKCNFARNATNCAGAWTTNEWNGMAPGGSGETWHYKISWVGACGAAGTPLPDGGYCIWNQYEVTFSHGTFANEHFWDAHARPNGFGSF